MRLLRVETLREKLGFDDMPSINQAITVALDQATAKLEQTLRTPFAAKVRTDTFMARETVFHAGQPETHLLLSGAFVRGSVTVIHAARVADLVASPVDISSDMTVDAEKGLLVDLANDLSGRFVRVSYTAGFPADATDPETYDSVYVPSWLQAATIAAARVVLGKMPSLGENASEVELTAQVNEAIGGKIRYVPYAVRPLTVSEVAEP